MGSMWGVCGEYFVSLQYDKIMIKIMAKFSIDNKKNDGEATIFLRVRRRKTDERKELDILVNTLLHCDDAKKWRDNYNISGKSDKYRRENKALFDKLDAVRDAVDNLIDTGVYDKCTIEKAVSDVVYKDLREQQKQERIKIMQQEQTARLDVVNAFDDFYNGIKSGEIHTKKGKIYTNGTVEIWRKFGVYLKEFCKDKHITFDMINKQLADKFITFMEKDKKLMPKTVLCHVINFRKLCNYYAEVDVNHNATSLRVWKEPEVKDENKRAATYLKEDELQSLYQMKLTGTKERVRDMFVMGALLCQRYSDYSNLWPDNFDKPLPDGTPCCRLTQRKTSARVVIPLYDYRLREICQKYRYHFPHNRELKGDGKERYLKKSDGDFTLQAFNRYLKDIMKELSKSVPSLNSTFVTNLTVSERRREDKYKAEHNGEDLFQRNERGEVVKPKWDIITAHTARRTGVTCLVRSERLTNRQIMRISGHSSEHIFEKYIREQTDDTAMITAAKLAGMAEE